MIINKMKASFGALDKQELDLKEGLNIVTADNEAGKSTWSHFIRAMLYGIDTSQRSKGGSVPDKTRFKPWNGANMEGTMELTAWDRPIRITRETQSASAPMRKFSAVFTDTGTDVENISGESAGQRLTGVEQPVFRRSCFMDQGTMAIDSAPELERRIQLLFSTGDEQSAYSEADELLRSWQRKIQHNNSGMLPKIQQRIAELEDKQRRQQDINRESAELRTRIIRAESTLAELTQQEAQHKLYIQAEQVQKRYNASSQRDMAQKRLEQTMQQVDEMGGLPQKEKLMDALSALDRIPQQTQLAEQARENLAAAENKLSAASREIKTDSAFAGQSPEQAWQTAQTVTSEILRLESAAKPKTAALVLLWIVCALLGVGTFLLLPPIVSIAAAGICIAAAIAVTAILISKNKKATAQKQKLLSQYNCSASQQILDAAAMHREQCMHIVLLETEKESAEQQLQQAQTQLQQLTDSAMEYVTSLYPQLSDPAQSKEKIHQALELLDRIQREQQALDQAQQLCSAVGEYMDEPLVDLSTLPRPGGTLESVRSELSETRIQLSNAGRELAKHSGIIMEIGDPAQIAAELDQLKARSSQLSDEYKALDGAVEVLKSANEQMRSRFSPQLNAKTADILEKLTGGKYASVLLSSDFDAEVMARNAVAARKANLLSQGTAQQVYLALRLAISDMVLPENCNPPLILDDCLAYFDDKRMALALDYLKQESKKRQVILFTCQSRESKYFADDPEVNLIYTQN